MNRPFGPSVSPISSARRRRATISRSSSRPRAPAASRWITCCSSGPPGLGKTTLAQIVSRELGVGFRATSGPVLARAGRSRSAPHQSRAPGRALHRRDPPPQSRGRGNPLSRDGGLRARSDHRRGAVGALGQDHARAVHARRRHDAHGSPHHAAARSLRHPHPALFLRDEGTDADRGARRARARSSPDR